MNSSLPHENYHKPGYVINIRILVSALIVLVLVVLLVIFLDVYARLFWRQPARLPRYWRSAPRRPGFHFIGQEPPRLRNVGLDSAILETLPIFLYKPQNFTDGLDCAVCLSELEENEKARLLPCGHCFHVECIDMWFRSHSSCPVCRTGAQAEQPVLESVRIEQVPA